MLNKYISQNKSDFVIFLLLLITLAQGFSSIFIFGQKINIIAYVNIALFVILFFKIIAQKKFLLIISFVLFVAYFSILGYFNGASAKGIYMHIFTYIPFINALLLIKTGTYYPIKKVLIYFTVATAIGALYAIVIRFYFPDILMKVIDVEDFDAFIQWGRLPWAGALMVILLISQMFFLNIYRNEEKIILVPALLLIFIGGFFTFNRTLIFALFIMILLLILIQIRNLRFKNIFLIFIGFFVVSYVFSSWANVNENFDNLLQGRILDPLSGKLNADSDISSRYMLYDQYIDNIKGSYFLGNGFGVPYSTIPEERVWADVTLVSFLIPFGLLGLAVFFGFIKKLYSNIKLIQNRKIKNAFTLVLILQLLISLNDDLWSHKNFPMYFVFIINSFIAQKKIRN
ncbi:MAG: hypothetical protein ACOH1X_06530 [Kaistella sp.]